MFKKMISKQYIQWNSLSKQYILDCSIAILDFLKEEWDHNVTTTSSAGIPVQLLPTPKQIIANDILNKNEFNIISFTRYINSTRNLNYKIEDEKGEFRPFFEKLSKQFYTQIVRELKLELQLELT